jgi:hypothetical protein
MEMFWFLAGCGVLALCVLLGLAAVGWADAQQIKARKEARASNVPKWSAEFPSDLAKGDGK